MIIVSSLTFEKLRQIGIGQGLNSTVWLVHDKQFKCELAIKEIDKNTFWNSDCFAEAQIVYSASHPNVVAVQYGCEEGTSAFIAMPFYPKGSLSDVLSSGPLGLSSALVLCQGILLGLEHIHIKGYLHLDIKPSNIFFDQLNRPLIADFGQARQIGPGGIVMAPPMYMMMMPPEVLQSGRAAACSDLYQVGALLYRAVNGENYWTDQSGKFSSDVQLQAAIKSGKFPDRNSFLPHVPKRLRTMIRKALEVNPTNRYQSASTMADQLGRISLACDWSVVPLPSDEVQWRSERPGNTTLIVDMKRYGGGWATEVHTENGSGNRRAKSKASLWRSFPSRERALQDLKRVFESLS